MERQCAALDGLLGVFAPILGALTLRLGYLKSEVEAANLFKLALRHAQGVVQLARCDLILLPPALVAARACFEATTKAAWMVNHDDPFQREARWLVQLETEERYLKRQHDHFARLGKSVSGSTKCSVFKEFRSAVEAKIPKRIARLKQMPAMPERLVDIGGENTYIYYRYLSEFTHGTHVGTGLYRTGLGTMKKIEENTTSDQWGIPLRVCCVSFTQHAGIFLQRASYHMENGSTAIEELQRMAYAASAAFPP